MVLPGLWALLETTTMLLGKGRLEDQIVLCFTGWVVGCQEPLETPWPCLSPDLLAASVLNGHHPY